MRLPKTRLQRLKRFAKAAETTHMLYLEFRKYFIQLGMSEEFVEENLNSLAVGDMCASDFLMVIEEELEYLED